MPNTPLTERLRLETRELHQQTERTAFMQTLIAGRIDRAAYAALLRNLHAIYAALEAALQQAGADAALRGLQIPALWRCEALADDLCALEGPRWPQTLALQPAADGYARRLQALAGTGSRALAAHAYVRYLGDLHGGQVLARVVARSLPLPPGRGTRFFDFGTEEQVLALRQTLREGLARMPLSTAEADQVVAEARWGFEQHRRLFEQLSSA